MVALCNRAGHYIFAVWFLSSSDFFFSSPNLSGRRLDVYHTSTHGVALVRIYNGPLVRAKFHPHRCNDKGVGPPKLKFLLRFDRDVEYKRPAGAYPLRDFQKDMQSLYLTSGCVRC